MSSILGRIKTSPVAMWIIKIGAYGFCALGLVYLGQKAFFDDPFSLDFKYFWVAGEVWAKGESPYTSAFSDLGAVFFPTENQLYVWAYPPNWWPVSTFLALFEHQAAIGIWRAMSAAMILGGAYFLRQSLSAQDIRAPAIWVAFFIGFAATMQSTAYSLNVGQTGVLIYFGACLLSYGVLAKRQAFIVAAVILLMLKPHVGGLVSLFLVVRPQYFRSVVIAGVISVLFALPAFIVGGFSGTITGLLTNLSAYSGSAANVPGITFGLQSLIFWLFNIDKVGFGYYAVIALLTLFASWRWFPENNNKAADKTPQTMMREFSLVLAVIAFVLPLHSYDLLFLLPILFFTPYFRRYEAIVIAAAFLIMYRYINVAELFAKPGDKGCLNIAPCSTITASMGTIGELMIVLALAAPAILAYGQGMKRLASK
ncbi:MAG: hypothetical protein DHS20C05_14860 [Hyphococcus sp.]|nr:MAG: hypothetical protein DHS20C05_14860 [Marinicaulis sp.]